ncbi:hypothetical protein Ga0123461_0108 [Mariprofundus aestuarium]|uniref:Uncharacterized protein n=1 Tax=Mariprofundus aestuarium TaxID=1921086 RepID=A0A2K8KYI6_MARES|nr:hypothetical protein [Mariprofundus aestuarium]ATX78561.1 hypothetical protein Ga0123461_0108 [Mariprofundus aestuarium]
MKIHSTNPTRVNATKVKKSEVKGGSFQELLHTRLDGIQPKQENHHPGEGSKNSSSTLDIIEDATLMLDQALEQIEKNGEPSEEVTHSLSLLRDRLKHGAPDSESLRAADAIIAVETSRLQSWKL